MDDEPYTKPHATFAETSSKPSTNQRLDYASQRAEVLFGCYRRGDANDPERYVAAIAAVLAGYDFELMKEVTDPRTGICATEKYMSFMPNAGELKVYCEALAARKERFKRLGDLPKPNFRQARLEAPEAPAGSCAHVFVPESHVRYAELVEWCNSAPHKYWNFGKSSDGRTGLWVAHGVWSHNPEFLALVAKINVGQAAE